MPWDPFLMKKLLKSEICGSMDSTLLHCLLQKSQHLRLLFNEQYMNSNRVTPKHVEKKKKKKGTKTQLVKRRRGFSGSKHTHSISPLNECIFEVSKKKFIFAISNS